MFSPSGAEDIAGSDDPVIGLGACHPSSYRFEEYTNHCFASRYIASQKTLRVTRCFAELWDAAHDNLPTCWFGS